MSLTKPGSRWTRGRAAGDVETDFSELKVDNREEQATADRNRRRWRSTSGCDQ